MGWNEKPSANIGTTSLMLIFVVLAMVTFALLSLSSGNTEWKLAQTMAERTIGYYEAENAATEMLRDVDDMLRELAAKSEAEEFEKEVGRAAEGLEDVKWMDGRLSWENEVAQGQVLTVAVRVVYPENQGDQPWQLEEWKLVSTLDWENDQPMRLYTGSE